MFSTSSLFLNIQFHNVNDFFTYFTNEIFVCKCFIVIKIMSQCLMFSIFFIQNVKLSLISKVKYEACSWQVLLIYTGSHYRAIQGNLYCMFTVLSVWFAVRCVWECSAHSGCDSHQSRLTDVIMNLFLSHSPRLGHFQRAKRFAGAVGNGRPLKADSSGTWELGHARAHCDELMLWHLPFLQALHKSRGALFHHRIQFHTPVGLLITLPNSD